MLRVKFITSSETNIKTITQGYFILWTACKATNISG